MTQARIILPQTDIEANATSFRRHLRAENLSPKTTKTYGEAVDQLAGFLRERGMPGRLAHIRREHVESFIEHLRERWAPAVGPFRKRFVMLLLSARQETGAEPPHTRPVTTARAARNS